MAKSKRTVGLITFLKGNTDPKARMPGCANYDHHYGGCFFRTVEGIPSNDLLEQEKNNCPCSVQEGRPCHYFEEAVLPTAADIGQQEHIYSLYESHVGKMTGLQTAKIRSCPDCGGELKPRRRLCDECRGRRDRDSKRKWKRK
jgi:hypothetical protein